MTPPPGFVQIDDEQIEALPAVGVTAFAVFVFLRKSLNRKTGDCFPSEKTIARGLGIGERTVRRAIGVLKAAGWVAINRQKGKSIHYDFPSSELRPNLPHPPKTTGQNDHTLRPKATENPGQNGRLTICNNQKNLTRESAPFVPPTLEEVKVYCSEKHLVMDPESCFDYYQGTGWVQGKAKTPIVDWKAIFRNWARKEKQFNGNGKHHYTPGDGQVYNPNAKPVVL